MRIRPEILLLVIALPLAACKDYGDFTVAEREWVDNDELPALSEMDLTGVNLEFAVGSKAHARVLPEVKWPDPIGMLMDRMKFENGGELPRDFELPLEDGCIYVGLEPRYSRFRRVEFQGRTLLFATYRVGSRISGLREEDQPEVELRLAIIDESRGMARHDLRIDTVNFDLVRNDTALGIVSNTGKSIYYRRLDLSGDALMAGKPVLLVSSDHGIDRMAVTTEPDGTFHLAWLTYDGTTTTENTVYYSKYGIDGNKVADRELLSEDARYRFLAMHWSTSGIAIAWADSRFARYGFSYSNISKIFVHTENPEVGRPRGPYALNIPLQDSDDAFRPIFAIPHNDAIAFLWGKSSSDSLDKADKQLGLFDVNNKSLTLAKSPIPHDDIISTAVRQQTEHQRGMPVAGFPALEATDCDQWEERLNLKPTGFGVITPQGYRPITTLDLEKNDDDGGGDRNDTRNDARNDGLDNDRNDNGGASRRDRGRN